MNNKLHCNLSLCEMLELIFLFILHIIRKLVVCGKNWIWTTSRGGARGMPEGATAPPKFCLPPQILPAPPVAPPKFFRSLSESPTQTIDSSTCCKTGPSSDPPKWNCLASPLTTSVQCKMFHHCFCEKKTVVTVPLHSTAGPSQVS